MVNNSDSYETRVFQYGLEMASKVIHRWWRGHLIKIHYKSEILHRHRMAIKIQTWYKAMIHRRRFIIFRRNSIIIQKIFRGYTIHKHVKKVRQDLNEALRICDQTVPIKFDDIFKNKIFEKIGQGIYGQTYLSINESIVIKIVPIKLFHWDQNENKTILPKAIADLKASKLVNELNDGLIDRCPNFIKIFKFSVVRGKFPQTIADADEEYYKINDIEPLSKLGSFGFYFIQQLEDAGIPIWNVDNLSLPQILSIIGQLCCSLSVAEEAFCFEHRDLHSGNILIRDTGQKFLIYYFKGEILKVPTFGMKVTIIDFSLARFTSVKMGTSFVNINVPENSFLYTETRGKWDQFWPKTNSVFIHQVAFQMLERYNKSMGNSKYEDMKLPGWYNKMYYYDTKVEFYFDCIEPELKRLMKEPFAKRCRNVFNRICRMCD